MLIIVLVAAADATGGYVRRCFADYFIVVFDVMTALETATAAAAAVGSRCGRQGA